LPILTWQIEEARGEGEEAAGEEAEEEDGAAG
jgi:hypothetical protein